MILFKILTGRYLQEKMKFQNGKADKFGVFSWAYFQIMLNTKKIQLNFTFKSSELAARS
jgi:hypothetical protein